MLKDKVRTLAYKFALKQLDGPILDIGCGTGILSLFCASQGAKVTAVEMASIATQAKEVIKKNGYEDSIELKRGKLEDLKLEKKYKGLVSEWMGYFLLYESMLDSVIEARDKYLLPGGKVSYLSQMYPNKAQMFLAPLQDTEFRKNNIDFWQKVHGFDYSPVHENAISEALVDIIESEQIIGTPCCISDFDLETITKEELDFVSGFEVKITQKGLMSGLVSWFDCWFTHNPESVLLSTSPHTPSTHWK